MPKSTITVSDEYLDVAQSLIYRAWSQSFDNLKATKTETPNYKIEPDWDQMHVIRLENAKKDFEKWERLKAESIDISPLTRPGSPFRKEGES